MSLESEIADFLNPLGIGGVATRCFVEDNGENYLFLSSLSIIWGG